MSKEGHPMHVVSKVKHHLYKSSVQLMAITRQLSELKGVHSASVMMATDGNKEMLREVGLLTPEADGASANDLVIIIRAPSAEDGEKALALAEEALTAAEPVETRSSPDISAALAKLPDATLALISVPGHLATAQARLALEAGLHVHLFSDNVPIEDERELKQLARDKGLLMMGAGAGTALINGAPLAFANRVRRGPIGIVSAAGTGLQEVSTLIHKLGLGVSQGLGTGGRDLSAEVGGLMMSFCLDALVDDPGSEVIVLISKAPASETAERMFETIADCPKPVVVSFVGADAEGVAEAGAIPAASLEDAARIAVHIAQNGPDASVPNFPLLARELAEVTALVERESEGMDPAQCRVRGLYSGGTLCSEALFLLERLTGDAVYSNIAKSNEHRLVSAYRSQGDCCVDLGDEEFTKGRLHPMIDPTIRQLRLLQEAGDASVAVVLLDVVLGFGSHPDMAGALVPAITEAKAIAQAEGRRLSVVATVVGTDLDPQNWKWQVSRLERAGVSVWPSNAQAVAFAALVARRLDESVGDRLLMEGVARQ
jgi:FdrA protein